MAGTSAIDPFFGSVVGAVGNVLGAAVATPPAGPSTSAPVNRIGIDFSNWTVATSGSKATAANDKKTATMPDWLMFAGMALLAVVAVRWAKAKS